MAVLRAGDAEINGLSLGHHFNNNSQYLITNVEALGLPSVRSTTHTIVDQHGSFFGSDDYYSARSVVIDMVIRATPGGGGPETVRRAMDELVTTTRILESDTKHNLDIWHPGDLEPWRYIGRTRAIQFPDESTTVSRGYARCTIRFDTELPSAVSVIETITPINFAQGQAGGWEYPRTYPYTYGGISASSAIIRNRGNFPYEPKFRINGPCVAPRIINETTGKTLLLNGTLTAGQVLEIDTREGSVLLGGASRFDWLDLSVSEFFTIEPGNNQIRWSPASGDGSSLDVLWRNARI